MTVNELIHNANKQIPFPWSVAKIKKAGHDPASYLLQFGQELERCSDANEVSARKTLTLLHELKMFG